MSTQPTRMVARSRRRGSWALGHRPGSAVALAPVLLVLGLILAGIAPAAAADPTGTPTDSATDPAPDAAPAPATPSGGASASPAVPGPVRGPTPPERQRPWVGPGIDWGVDTAASVVAEAHSDFSLVGRTFDYPLSAAGVHDLSDLSTQSAGVGAVAVVNLDPGSLSRLDDADATVLATALAQDASTDGSRFLVRFAPDMNSGAVPWGLAPDAYVRQFRRVASAVHQATDAAALVWSPTYGGGYPHTASVPSRQIARLDTDHNGVLDDADDPYGPYFPGVGAVDWVGLTMPAATSGGSGESGPESVDAHFLEQADYTFPPASGRRATFYVRFAGHLELPLLLTTGYGDATWFDQVISSSSTRPQLRGVFTDSADDAVGLGARTNLGPDTIAPVVPGHGGGLAEAASRARNRDATRLTDRDGAHGPWTYFAGLGTALALVFIAALILLQVRRRRGVPQWLR